MFDKLRMAEARYDEISMKITDPDVISDNKRYRELLAEQHSLEPLIEVYRKYNAAEKSFEEAKEILDDGSADAELKNMAQEEYAETKRLMEEYTEQLKILLLPKDPDDDKNVIVEIRAGAGGEEAAHFANSMFRMYTMYAAN